VLGRAWNAAGRWIGREYPGRSTITGSPCSSYQARTPQLQQLASTRTPFAIKDGGHTLNPGFSSTPGVQISLVKFNDIVIHEDSETVEIGAGLTWMEVYSYIVPKGINVVGGRSGSVGVSGYTLGGGT
jgi:FAD/FMN-containing dehydrogenase